MPETAMKVWPPPSPHVVEKLLAIAAAVSVAMRGDMEPIACVLILQDAEKMTNDPEVQAYVLSIPRLTEFRLAMKGGWYHV